MGTAENLMAENTTYQTIETEPFEQSIEDVKRLYPQTSLVSRAERELLNGHRGKVIWFTGLSGSGKSTLANALEIALHAQGRRTYLLDGDNLRLGLNMDLGFSISDRVENMRRIIEVAHLMLNAGLVVLVASIAPFAKERDRARIQIGAADFVEVYVNTPIEICEQRDVKGLYKKAREKKISNMTGISSPYEAPDSPAYVAMSHEMSVAQTIRELLDLIADI